MKKTRSDLPKWIAHNLLNYIIGPIKSENVTPVSFKCCWKYYRVGLVEAYMVGLTTF